MGRRLTAGCLAAALCCGMAVAAERGPVAAVRDASICPARRFEAPVADGPFDHCIDVGAGYRICRRRSDEDATVFMSVERGRKPVATWATGSFMGDTSDFDVAAADLDGDGAEELVVASRYGQTVGMATNRWEVAIVEDLAAPKPSLVVEVEEYGTGSLVATDANVPCALLVTRWVGLDDRERGRGLYLWASLARYREGALSMEPAVARRYVASFERQRTETPRAATPMWIGGPLAWLQEGELEQLGPDAASCARAPREAARGR